MKMLPALAVLLVLSGCAPSPEPKPAAAVPTPIDRTPVPMDLTKFAGQGAVLHGYDENEGRMYFWSNGKADGSVRIPAAGDYEIVITASCQAALGEFAKFRLEIDDAPVGAEVALTSEDPKEHRLATTFAAGDRKVTLQFTNDAYKENEYDRNLYINKLEFRRLK